MKFIKTLFTQTRIILITLLTVILLFTLTGEKVARFEQSGWDGREYREMAQTFSEKINGDSYNTYKYSVYSLLLLSILYSIFSDGTRAIPR